MGNDFDVVQEWLEENDAPDEILKAVKGSGLRKQLSEANAEIERLKPFEDKVTKLEKAPVREKFFREVARVDYENLRPAEKKLLETFDWDGDEPDAEAVTQFVTDFDLPTVAGEPTPNEPQPASAAFATQTGQAARFPTPTPVADEIAGHEEAAAKARAEGNAGLAQQHTKAAMALKNSKLKPEGLAASSV